MKQFEPEPQSDILRLDEPSLLGFARLNSSSELRVFVPHTTFELTRTALTAIAEFSRNLDARVTLVAVMVVPFPLPLDHPDVAPEFLEQRLTEAAREIDARVDVQIVVARERDIGLEQVIPPGSLVVVATKKRLWLTVERRLARSLARAGMSVGLLAV